MNPHTKHTSLFFTPRTPWGTRLTGRTFRNHMRASEDAPTDLDEQHPLSGKELQGLGGGMAPNQLGRLKVSPEQSFMDQHDVPHALSGQTSAGELIGNGDKKLEFSRYHLQPSMSSQTSTNPHPLQAAQPWLHAAPVMPPSYWHSFNPAHIPQEGEDKKNYFDGKIGYDGTHPGSSDPPDKTAILRFSTHPESRGPLPDLGRTPERKDQYDDPPEEKQSPPAWKYKPEPPTNHPFLPPPEQTAPILFDPPVNPPQPFKKPAHPFANPFELKAAPATLQSSPFNQSFQPNRSTPKLGSKK